MNTSCSVWRLQFSEEMLFPSWARWGTLDKTFLGSMSLTFLGVVVCCCCFFVCFSYSFILFLMSYDHSEIILVRYFTSRWPYFHELQVRCAYST